jgi:hypothetical protein
LLSFSIVAFTLAFWPAWMRVEDAIAPMPEQGGRLQGSAIRLVRAALATIGLSAIAGLAAAPITIQTFRSVSIVSVASNALVAPAVAATMPTAVVGYAACLACPPLGALVCERLLSPLAGYVLRVGGAFASFPAASVAVPAPGWPVVSMSYLALGVLAHKATRLGRSQ